MDVSNEEQLSEQLRTAIDQQINSPSKGGGASDGLSSPARKGKGEDIRAVRLSNNQIKRMDMLAPPMIAALDTSKILWLDLSFNQISRIGEGLDQVFPNITTIYLQANSIRRLSEIKKFAAFKELKSLALYGNPVEEHKHYRNYVLYMCPKLTQFDASPVTKSERKKMEVWAQTFRKVLATDEEED